MRVTIDRDNGSQVIITEDSVIVVAARDVEAQALDEGAHQ